MTEEGVSSLDSPPEGEPEGLSWQIKLLQAFLWVAIALVIGGFVPRSDQLRRLVGQAITVPDARIFYGSSDLSEFLELIRAQPEAASLYANTQLTLDAAFPFAYCGVLFLLLHWLLGRASGHWRKVPLRRLVLAMPVIVLVSDLAENLFLRSLTLAEVSSTTLTTLAISSSATKWVSSMVTAVVVLFLVGRWRAPLLQAAFLCRVPLLTAGVMWLLAYASNALPTISNMRIARGWPDLVAVGFFSTLVAAMCGLNVLMVLRFGPKRHGLSQAIADDITRNTGRPVFREWPLLALLPSAIVAWPAWVAVFRSTLDGSEVPILGPGTTASCLAVGGLLGVGLLIGIQKLWQTLEGRAFLERRLAVTREWLFGRRWVRLLVELWGSALGGRGRVRASGYGPPEDHLPGHLFSATLLGVLLVLYFLWYHLFAPPERATWLPALASVLALLLVMCSLLSGATFFLDRFRVPLILALVAWTVIGARLFPRDHLFETRELDARPVTTKEVLERRLRTVSSLSGEAAVDAPKTMTVVLGVGGGIVASAWTNRVLTGLHETYGQSFTDSIVLLSTVSGSSVGAYYYLEAMRANRGQLDARSIEAIRRASVGSSLEETAWGLAFPDLLRAFVPMLVSREKDRAWASERAWLRHRALMVEALLGSDSRSDSELESERQESAWLSDWMVAARKGYLPAVILNATVVEDGELFLLSNAALEHLARRRFDPTLESHFAARCPSGQCIYPFDLPAVTAARLSSTFPYASPIARGASSGGRLERVAGWHAADGGYVDNIGAIAAIAWLRDALARMPGHRLPRVAVLLLNGFEETPDDLLDVNESRSWTFATLGPLQTLLKVRDSSQVMRAHFELDLLEHQENVPADQAGPNRHPTISVIEIRPSFEGGADPQPVSWSLSPRDIRKVEQNWRDKLPCLAEELERLGLYGEVEVGECRNAPRVSE